MHDKESNIAAENCGESSFQESLSWRDGRRIAELWVLGEAPRKYCVEDCSSTLELRNTGTEKRYGFAFTVTCMECGALNSMKTSKSHHAKKKGAPVYDEDAMAAGAMIHSGFSVTGMQKFMASLEVPPVIVRTFKKTEKEIRVTTEKEWC